MNVEYCLVLAELMILLLLLWQPLNTLASVSPSSLALSGCKPKCGDVDIPYPFGIGSTGNSSCYLDKWFEIECQNNTRPVLRGVNNLEVLEISLEKHEIRFNSPIMSSSDCNDRPAAAVLNLTGSTFSFSETSNSFTAVGRKDSAIMRNIEPDVIGCAPRKSNCSEGIINCCQTTLPYDLQVFNVGFEDTDTDGAAADTGAGECKYAFIVDKDWFLYNFTQAKYKEWHWVQYNSSSTALSVSALHYLYYVPAVLDWGFPYRYILPIQNSDSRTCFNPYDRTCRGCEYGIEAGIKAGRKCRCAYGFEGSPYIKYGCQDRNECEDGWAECSDTCVNTYGSYKCRHSRLKLVIIVLGSVLGAVILVIGIWRLCRYIKKSRKTKLKKKFFKRNGGLLLKQQLSSSESNVDKKLFTSKELEKATDNFNVNRILGQGGQGTVYKGMLPDGRIVAVKKSKIEDEREIEPFINEVVILSQINHRNIVKLIGCCLETEVPLLIYEFVPNGTLSQYLHGQIEEVPVSWEMRLQIATEVAGALSYLHSSASFPIYHRDIKSSNILLDDKYRAKIADFGTSRSVAIDQTHLTTLVHGTFGYLDPEYFRSSQFTDKSNVYSFGVVLVELLTGQRAISSTRSEEGRSLAAYFMISMEQNQLFDILDARVVKQGGKDEMIAVANLAKRCLNLDGRKRPTMREVSMELERIRTSHISFNGVGNYEEIECVRSQETGLWDAASTSTADSFISRCPTAATKSYMVM